MLISIVIPAFNAEKTLPACLEACLSQTHPETEIIVVDDGSSDRTAALAGEYPEIKLFRQSNAGPAAARNHGAKMARGDIVAFTDSDCVPRRDWLEKLLAGFDDNVAGVGGSYDIQNPQCLLARLVQAEIEARHAQMTESADFLGSFNVAYRRCAFESVNGFDESFRQASGEDNDLAYRLHDAGWRLYFCPTAVVGHWHPTHLPGYLRTQTRHGFWRAKLYSMHPARTKGDCYAGWPDLLAPPLALATLALAIPALLGWLWSVPWVMTSYALLPLVQTLLHAPMTWRIARGAARKTDTVCFPLMAMLRDYARALGMLQGLWFFSLRGKERGQ